MACHPWACAHLSQVALRLHTLGLSWTGSSAFDYSVDFLAWLEYVRLLELEASGLRWPWDPDKIEIWELEEGISERYKSWLEAHGHQAGTPQDPKGHGDLSPSKLLELQAASSQPSGKLPKAPDQTQAQGHIARVPCADLILDEDWECLSSKYKKKRAKKLASRGLPIPSEGGFISIVAI